MSVVLSTGRSDLSRLPEFRTSPRFRKATSNMVLGFDALQEVMAGLSVSEEIKKSLFQNSAFVLGSSYGEIEYTKDFLKSLVISGLARPLLFQSSLHNATLGFLTLELQMPGPSFTVSQRYFTGEKCLETAIELLKAKVIETCFVLSTDVMSEELLPSLHVFNKSGFVWKGGAGALLLSTDEKAKELGITPLATIDSIQFSRSGNEIPKGNFYDSDGLENFTKAIRTQKKGEIILPKPDQSFSKISWS